MSGRAALLVEHSHNRIDTERFAQAYHERTGDPLILMHPRGTHVRQLDMYELRDWSWHPVDVEPDEIDLIHANGTSQYRIGPYVVGLLARPGMLSINDPLKHELAGADDKVISVNLQALMTASVDSKGVTPTLEAAVANGRVAYFRDLTAGGKRKPLLRADSCPAAAQEALDVVEGVATRLGTTSTALALAVRLNETGGDVIVTGVSSRVPHYSHDPDQGEMFAQLELDAMQALRRVA